MEILEKSFEECKITSKDLSQFTSTSMPSKISKKEGYFNGSFKMHLNSLKRKVSFEDEISIEKFTTKCIVCGYRKIKRKKTFIVRMFYTCKICDNTFCSHCGTSVQTCLKCCIKKHRKTL